MAARIRSASATYTTSVKDISYVDIDSQALVQKYRDGLLALRNRDVDLEAETTDAEQPARRKGRSRHGTVEEKAEPDTAVPDALSEEADE